MLNIYICIINVLTFNVKAFKISRKYRIFQLVELIKI